MAKAVLKIVHPRSDDSGCMMSLEFHYQTDERPAFVRVSFARQKGEAFVEENALQCDLFFDGLTRFLAVLRGDEDAMNGGVPVEVSSGAKFAARSVADGGVAVAALVNGIVGKEQFQMLLNKYEVLGLKTALESSMFFFSFVKGITP